MIRIGIVGCGRILAAHLRGYRRLREAGIDDFQITALCARKKDDACSYVKRGQGPPQRLAVSDMPGDPLAVGDEYLSDFQPDVDVAIYTDYEEMISDGPIDAVNDFTVHRLHHLVAEKAFAHGKHLMSQKPLALTIEGARRMCAQAESANVTFGVFENLRFATATRQMAWAFSDSGPLGDFQMALMGNVGTWWAPDLIVAETPWRHLLDDAGGITLDLGPHFFDMIRHIGGSEITYISGQTEVVEPTRYLIRDGKKIAPISCGADDTFYASFSTDNGASGTLFGSWAGHGSNTVVGEGPVFYGSKGRVSGDLLHIDGEPEPQSLSARYATGCPDDLRQKHFPLGPALTDDFALNQHDWLEAVRHGRQPETSGEEGLRDLACAYAVVESAKAGRRVSVNEILSGSLRDYQQVIDAKHNLL
jgi:predicted dehydrogenase